MLAYDLSHWVGFFAAALLLNLSPGPDIAFILSRSLTGDLKLGSFAMFGVWTGTLLHVLLASLGISGLLLASAELFHLVKWLGAAYLVWLGFQSLRGSGRLQFTPSEDRKAFVPGILVSALNPKVGLFFLAFLPQFVVEGAGPVPLQLAIHGLLVIVVAACVEPFIVFGAVGLSNQLRTKPAVLQWLDRCFGALLILLGIRLAIVDRT